MAKTQYQELETNNLPNASEYYYDQYSRNDESTFSIEKETWKQIKQNNSSGKYLTDKELEYIGLINGFLKNSYYGVEYISIEYLCNRLGVKERQLRTIRKNTSHIFKTRWRKATLSYKGRLEDAYAIRPTEHTVFLLGETNYYKSEYNSFVNYSVKSIKDGSRLPTSIYKYENKKNIDLGELDPSSNISNLDNSACSSDGAKNTTDESVEKEVVVGKKKPLGNSRKKVTNSERVTRYQKFKAYDKPKNLAEHYPLSQEDTYELQQRSGKAYSLHAMNEILLDMSRKPELQGHSFVSKAKFMAYMTKAYREEGRDVDKANSPTFKIIKRRPQAEITEIITLAQREKYLNEVEDSAIHTRCDYTQFRARVAGQFPINLGYELLSNMLEVKKKDAVFEVTMHKEVEVTEHYKLCVLDLAKGIGGYAGVNKMEFN